MKVLLITDTTAEPAYGDWVSTLKREGVPFDSLVTNPTNASPAPADGTTPLPTLSSTLSDGTQVASYESVIVATSGTEGLSTAQWTTLQTFEQQFFVRQLTAYASPGSSYGLGSPSPSGGATMDGTTPVALTTDGATTFPYLKTVALDTGTWGYEASPLTTTTTPTLPAGASVDTLISGPSSSSLLGIYTSPDGRQTMYQTFDENQYMLQSELLRHGELAWLTRNTYFGDQRNYLETHVDDNFLSDDAWSVAGNATTAAHSTDFNAADALREVPADVTAAASWSSANKFRIDMLFNGGGSVAVANGDSLVGSGDGGSGGTGSTGTTTGTGTGIDSLLAAFQATDSATHKPYTDDFGWISHTWDHPNVDEGCATQGYIEAELNQNTNWGAASGSTAGNALTGGLGLTESTDPTAALGNENPNAVITGEHSGLANLLPGNPGQVDPPGLDSADPATTTTGSLTAGAEYVYAVSDQFNTAAPGATPVAGTGESAASVSAPVTVTATGAVTLTWGAVCHAADYKIYRGVFTPTAPGATTGAISAWTLITPTPIPANTTTDFTDGTSSNPTTSANNGGGAVTKTFTDNGAETGTTAATPLTAGTANESAYEQNPVLDAAFAGTLDGGIKYFGADASKPYPNAADSAFTTGAFGGASTEYPSGATFSDAGATGIPRYPTNIYYNVSTNAQEVDEYETLYDSPTCTPITGVTTCNAAGTAFTIAQIVASVDQGMFQHMMGNDPRPDYFHQTNLMSQTSGGANYQGDGLFYETVNPLLAQYNSYFASSAPIEQLTMAQIGTLLSEQAGWATANASQVAGYIQGNVVTVSNGGAAVELPLTGTNVGSAYAGSVSGWTLAPTGTSTYTALAAWPAPPIVPVAVQPPTGPAPTTGSTTMPGPAPAPAAPATTPTTTTTTTTTKTPTKTKTTTTTTTTTKQPTEIVKPASDRSLVVQVAPKTVRVKRGSVTVSLKCEAAKGQVCSGKFTLRLSGKTVTRTFRIGANKIDRIATRLPEQARTASSKHGRSLLATLLISTKQSSGSSRISTGKLTIKS